MKRLVPRDLYTLKGAEAQERTSELRGVLGLGTEPSGYVVSDDVTTGVSVTGVTTNGVQVSGNSTSAFKTVTGTFTNGVSIGGTVTTGVAIGTCTTGITIGQATTGISMTGTKTNGISITGTVANGINILAASTMTNLLKFDAIAGCVLGVDVNPKDVPSGGGLGADACIRIDIGGQDYFIPIFAVELS